MVFAEEKLEFQNRISSKGCFKMAPISLTHNPFSFTIKTAEFLSAGLLI
jgi:hypothetical protein